MRPFFILYHSVAIKFRLGPFLDINSLGLHYKLKYNNMKEVIDQSQVKVHYTGTLDDGSVFDSSEGREPLAFKVGAGNMIPGFEKAVLGMKLNETKSVTIPCNEAYGPVRDDLIQELDKSILPEGLNPHVGQKLQSQDNEGRAFIVVVKEVKDKTIVIDGNHELAGKDLQFEIRLVELS